MDRDGNDPSGHGSDLSEQAPLFARHRTCGRFGEGCVPEKMLHVVLDTALAFTRSDSESLESAAVTFPLSDGPNTYAVLARFLAGMRREEPVPGNCPSMGR